MKATHVMHESNVFLERRRVLEIDAHLFVLLAYSNPIVGQSI